MSADADIWHDDEGMIWRQIGPLTFGPFPTEAEAEAFEPGEGFPLDIERYGHTAAWRGDTG